jgi:hypothetical protein
MPHHPSLCKDFHNPGVRRKKYRAKNPRDRTGRETISGTEIPQRQAPDNTSNQSTGSRHRSKALK